MSTTCVVDHCRVPPLDWIVLPAFAVPRALLTAGWTVFVLLPTLDRPTVVDCFTLRSLTRSGLERSLTSAVP